MGLFDFFKKKKKENDVSGCSCGCGGHHHHEEKCSCGSHHHHEEQCSRGHHHHHDEHCSCGHHHHEENCCCGEPVKGICCVKVLGACDKSLKQLEHVKEAVKNLGLDVPVTQLEDVMEIMEFDVLSLPAVVVNDKVVCNAKVADTAEIENILKRYL